MIIDETIEKNTGRNIVLILLVIAVTVYFFSPFLFPKVIPKIYNNTTIIYVDRITTVLVTPTADGKEYFANEYESGIRKMNNPFSWYRENVSGLKDMFVTANVYDYKIFNSLTPFDPTNYKYYKLHASSGNKFIFIFFDIYMDDNIGNDPRAWLIDDDNIAIQYNKTQYYPLNYPKQLRFKELENVVNLNKDYYIQAYGQQRMYNPSLEYKSTAGEMSYTHYYLRGGISNRENGYILFEIPQEAKINEIYVNINFSGFGQSTWVLKW